MKKEFTSRYIHLDDMHTVYIVHKDCITGLIDKKVALFDSWCEARQWAKEKSQFYIQNGIEFSVYIDGAHVRKELL